MSSTKYLKPAFVFMFPHTAHAYFGSRALRMVENGRNRVNKFDKFISLSWLLKPANGMPFTIPQWIIITMWKQLSQTVLKSLGSARPLPRISCPFFGGSLELWSSPSRPSSPISPRDKDAFDTPTPVRTLCSFFNPLSGVIRFNW